MDKKKLIQYAVIFLLSYLVVNIFFNPNKDQAQPTSSAPFEVVTSKKQYGQDEIVLVTLRNNTEATAYVYDDCPGEPLTVLKKEEGEWKSIISSQPEIPCDKENVWFVLDPATSLTLSYQSWNHALFGEVGTYKITAEFRAQANTSTSIATADSSNPLKIVESNEFEVTQRSFFSWLWATIFYQPIYNALMYLVSVLPSHDLGWAIIILTLLMRTILLIPSHRGLKSQRKMQELQPKLNHLKEKYKDNQQMLTQQTMLLWKEHKVNPLSSCLPLVIQIPILIALYNFK